MCGLILSMYAVTGQFGRIYIPNAAYRHNVHMKHVLPNEYTYNN